MLLLLTNFEEEVFKDKSSPVILNRFFHNKTRMLNYDLDNMKKDNDFTVLSMKTTLNVNTGSIVPTHFHLAKVWYMNH